MKIGILTYHRPCNFGANLQAYASTRYLQSLGHEVKVIDYVRDRDLANAKKVSVVQFEAHQYFIESRLSLTRQAFNGATLCDIVAEEQFDCIIIESDAVWRAPEDDCIFFAKWLFDDERIKNVPVCALSAAHMGKSFKELPESKRNDIKSCLDKFRYITVRDEWTRQAINRDIDDGKDRPITVNPDPVFMLPTFIEGEIWENRGLEEKKYVLMTLPRNWLKGKKTKVVRKLWFHCFKHLVHKAGLKLVEFPVPEGKSGLNFDLCIDYPLDPVQWFLFIKNAGAFVGLRFHAIVSCISWGTPFYSIDSYGDKSKRRNWLDRLGQHEKARALDYHSKIRKLLKDTPFEDYRTGNIEWESPKGILDKILNTPAQTIAALRDDMQQKYQFNLDNLLSSVTRPPRAILSLAETCTGCFACANVCPKDAITLPENHEGFYFPVIDSSRCIDCGLCDKVCPVITDKPATTMRKAYYGWSNDDMLRRSSSSGGMFAMLSQMILNQKGVVYGSAWNTKEGIRLETMSSEDVSMQQLQKSKYVQSYVGDAFRRVKADLLDGKQVLYCGTPCQMAGLRSFLGKDYDNLLCIDFVCHGVPSMSLLRQDLSFHGLNDIEDIVFRPKNRSWMDDFRVVHNHGKVWERPWKLDEYYLLFENSLSLRRSCYSCRYCNGNRASDITIGDFWGVKKYKPELWDKRGISLVLANTEKGEAFITKLQHKDSASVFDLPIEYAKYVYSRNRQAPTSKYGKAKRDAFLRDVYLSGYKEALTRHKYKVPQKAKIKFRLKSFTDLIKNI